MIASLAALLVAAFAAAQDEGHDHAAEPAGTFGRVHFPVSCNAEAQEQVEHGVALLHSFWYEEAERAFTAAAAADPGCAMASWGVAMSQYHPIWYPPTPAELARGIAAVARATAIGGKTDRERAYIGAIEVFYKDADRLDHKTRAQAYEKAMEAVYRGFPEDHEAAAFYAVALLWTLSVSPTDETNPRKAAAVLDKIAAQMPDHPGVYHYYIHAYDSPSLAPLALDAARGYAKVAPAVPHALHMPSHIFTRLGLWKESIESNLASAAASRDFELRTRMAGAWDQELHALDYLEYAYLQTGEDEKAKAIVERIREIHSVQPQSMSAAFALSAVPARYAVEGHRWKEAAALALAPADFPWKSFPIGQAMNGWARALGLIHTSDLSSARKETDALAALRDAVKTQPGYDWSSAIEVLRLSASGWLSHAEGRDADARTALQAAADLEDSIDKHAVSPGAILPAREQLADFLLEAEHPEEALREYQASSRSAPNRFAALWGGGRAAQEAGRPTQAKAFYERLLESADPGSARPELARAKAFISRSEGSSSR